MNLRVVILLAIAACAACHRQAGPTALVPAKPKAGMRAATPASGPSPQELTAGMVEAVTQGKSPAPLELKFDLRERPADGQPLEVALALLPHTAARSATVVVSGSDGLKLESGDDQFDFPQVEAAQVYRHSIKVTPTGSGLHLLTLSVSLQHDQTADSAVYSVPILVVGTAGSPPAGNAARLHPGTGAPAPDAAHRGS